MSYNEQTKGTEAAAVAQICAEANAPAFVPPQGLAVFPDGRVRNLDFEGLRDHPKRKRGLVCLSETSSFIEYVNAHSTPDETHIFGVASEAGGEFKAVIDFHGRGDADPNWGEHVCVLKLATTPEWQRWTARNGQQLTQEAFAEFLEDNMQDIVNPDAGTLLDVAQLLTGKKSVTFRSGKNLKNGAIALEYSETIESTGGRSNGDMQVPDKFTLMISPFIGVDPVALDARLRYRISDSGKLSFSFILNRPHKIVEAAFNTAREAIKKGTDLFVHLGTPSIPAVTLP